MSRGRGGTSRAVRVIRVAGAALVLALLCGYILLSRPQCQILKHTGFYCAGCGVQRMLWALLRGDLLLAFRMNPFMLFFLPAAALYFVVESVRYIQEKPLICRSRWFLWTAIAVLAASGAFMVARNFPGSALAPVG